MKLKTLMKKLKSINDYDMQKFWEKDFSGSCPCFSGEKTIEGKKIGFCGRCWRVSDNAQDLYYWGEWDRKTLRMVAKEVKRALDAQEWYNPYTLIFKKQEKSN